MLTRFNISSQRPISTEPEKGKRRREEGEEAMGLGRGCIYGVGVGVKTLQGAGF